jgi:hypothetical protein
MYLNESMKFYMFDDLETFNDQYVFLRIEE